jgi:hypothetical protein
MTKSKLKTGYVVKYRDGTYRMVMKLTGGDAVVGMEGSLGWNYLESWNQDLTHQTIKSLDIVEVYGYSSSAASAFRFIKKERKLLWKRPEKKQYTYAQLREILGEEFEVIG